MNAVIMLIIAHSLDYVAYLRGEPQLALITLSLLFVFIATPPLILHLDYYLRNKRAEYEILPDRIITRKNIREETYLKADIEKIYVNLHRWLTWSYFFDLYSFARVDMKNGESIYLTSLLCPKKTKDAEEIIKNYFTGIPYYKIKRGFCTTRTKSRYEKGWKIDEEKEKSEIDFLFENDDREYDSITEFKDTRNQGLPSVSRSIRNVKRASNEYHKTKIENKNINTNDPKKS